MKRIRGIAGAVLWCAAVPPQGRIRQIKERIRQAGEHGQQAKERIRPAGEHDPQAGERDRQAEECNHQTGERDRQAEECNQRAGERGQQAKESDQQAEERNRQAERLLDQYGSSILRYAYTFVHSRADAEEILQETLIRFLKNNPAFESGAHEKAWLLRVAGNLAKNRAAYNKIRTSDELNEELVSEQREDLSFVWEAVRSLPENQRSAIHLYYQEGYDTAGIASVTGRRESTVRSDLRRGRLRLKEILKEKYDFEG